MAAKNNIAKGRKEQKQEWKQFINQYKALIEKENEKQQTEEYTMPLSRSVDIDTMDDMFIAESLIKNGILEGKEQWT